MIKIYKDMSCEEWFNILELISKIRKSYYETAKMNQKTYKVFEYFKAKYIGWNYHFNKDGKFIYLNEYVSSRAYEKFQNQNYMKSNHAIIAGCKISIDETIDDGEVIIKI